MQIKNYCPIKTSKDEDFRVFIAILVFTIKNSPQKSYTPALKALGQSSPR